MHFYEHPAQVTVPTPLLKTLISYGFYDSSYGNDLWPSFSYDIPPDGNYTITVTFLGDTDGYGEPTAASLMKGVSVSRNTEEVEWVADIALSTMTDKARTKSFMHLLRTQLKLYGWQPPE